MNFSVIIPALEKNHYNINGDLAAFGDTTLLEWKISQCREIIDSSKIFISSDSDLIKNISLKEGVNFIKRKNDISYKQTIKDTLLKIEDNNILWTNSTSPFLGSNDYISMIDIFIKNDDINSIASVYSKYDYVYYNNSRLNFTDLSPRKILNPIQIITNGCFVVDKNFAIEKDTLITDESYLYELDYLSSIEIKDMKSYQISTALISEYFKKNLSSKQPRD